MELNFICQIEEEENLIQELKKIEQRKKEREKKTQDLQKLITAADSNIDSRRGHIKNNKKKVQPQKSLERNVTILLYNCHPVVGPQIIF